jgi:hypothetical protein
VTGLMAILLVVILMAAVIAGLAVIAAGAVA